MASNPMTLAAIDVSGIQIDKNDLLAIAVSKAELYMQNQLAAATKEIRQLEKAIKAGEASLTAKVTALAAVATQPSCTQLEEAKKLCASSAKVRVRSEMQQDKRTFSADILIVRRDDRYNDGFTFGHVTGNFDSDTTAVAERLEADSEKLDNAREAAVSWRKRLAQIPMLERQYRARLAEATLSKTEHGKALLDALGNQFESDVLALPGI